MNRLEQLAAERDLLDRIGLSPTGLPERYPYSKDMTYRYAFARWWGEQHLARAVVWVLLNPATGDTDHKPRPTLERAIVRSMAWGDDRCGDRQPLRLSGHQPQGAEYVGPHFTLWPPGAARARWTAAPRRFGLSSMTRCAWARPPKVHLDTLCTLARTYQPCTFPDIPLRRLW